MVTGSPSRMTLRPTIDGAPPNFRCHSPYPMMATPRAGVSSLVENVRPTAGTMPTSSKNPP